MNAELATIPANSLAEKAEWARLMAPGDILPRQYRGNPANLMFAVEYADALGIPRINALTSIHIIDGKPTASADLIASLVRKAGHKMRITGDDTSATVTIIRADDPDFETTVTWDIAKARVAGKWGSRGPWTNYPGAMLRSRAITECARMAASDALYGVIYTAEELTEQVDGNGNPVFNVTSLPRGRQAGPAQTYETVVEQDAAPGPEPEPLPDIDVAALTEQAYNTDNIDTLRDIWKQTNGHPESVVGELISLIMARQSDIKKAQEKATEVAAVATATDVLNAEVVDISHLTEAPADEQPLNFGAAQ